MSTIPQPPSGMSNHPAWCSPNHCVTDPESGDVCHRSQPQTLTFREGSATFHLQVVDEAGFPTEVVEVESIIRIRPATVWPDGKVELYLNTAEMALLAERVTTERQRALLMSAPVLRPAVEVVAA